MGELAMAYEDCDTIPLLWQYASRFVLFDHVFQEMTGPSTLGNIAIIAAQTGQTQWALHPDEAYKDDGAHAPGVPVMNDNDPLWGSPLDPTPKAEKMPVNPHDFGFESKPNTQINLTFASLPLTLQGKQLKSVARQDRDPGSDLADVRHDIPFISRRQQGPVGFGWYEEGYGSARSIWTTARKTLPASTPPTSRTTTVRSISDTLRTIPRCAANSTACTLFLTLSSRKPFPKQGGVFFVKGGYKNIFGINPADPDPRVQKNFKGDDDHPAYSDAQISEALVARGGECHRCQPLLERKRHHHHLGRFGRRLRPCAATYPGKGSGRLRYQ